MESKILCAMPEATFRRMFTTELAVDLEGLGEVTHCHNGSELHEDVYAALWRSADVAVTGWGVRPPAVEMLEGAPLRAICHTAGSVRMFPRGILERGVVITTARAAIARTVGEYCLMMALRMLRRPQASLDGTRVGNETLFNRAVGLIGYGCVGREFRSLLRPFGCRVLVYDPYLSLEDAAAEEIELVGLDELLPSSKVVSLHAPDVPETRGMIGADQLALIVDGAVLINSARGRLIDTAALTSALALGRFSAALDVTEPEPLPAGHPLRDMGNVLLTPHTAGPTDDELPRMTRMALEDLRAVLEGREPRWPVSLEAYDRMSF